MPRCPATKMVFPFSSKMGLSGDAMMFCRAKLGGVVFTCHNNRAYADAPFLPEVRAGRYALRIYHTFKQSDEATEYATHSPASFGIVQRRCRIPGSSVAVPGRARVLSLGRHPSRIGGSCQAEESWGDVTGRLNVCAACARA
jgi:hypothetical protein